MDARVEFDGGSFKDPSGRVFYHDGGVYRALNAAGRAEFDALTASGLYDALVGEGCMVSAEPRDPAALGLDRALDAPFLLEHERIPFITYPYEWSFEMLRDAALLTLDILERALDHDLILKDATPFNVQFHDGRPVFIDVLSFEPYRQNEPWVGYAQFCSSFLYPLMLTAYRGVEFQPFLRGGLGTLACTDMARLLSWRDAFKPGVLAHVLLQARFQRGFERSDVQITSRFAEIQFSKEMLLANVRRLRKTLGKLRYTEAGSVWNEYATANSYSEADREAKAVFVREALAAAAPGTVWDLGCNTGAFSQLAAEAGARVVAIDGDPAVVDRLYRGQKAGERSPRIQPLVGDLGNPSPALGWNLSERRAWLDRGRADFVLALALVHHLAIGGNIPLAEYARFLRRVAPAGVTEFVTKADPMVQRLLANRRDVFDDYTPEVFEAELGRHFRLAERRPNEAGTRILYRLSPG